MLKKVANPDAASDAPLAATATVVKFADVGDENAPVMMPMWMARAASSISVKLAAGPASDIHAARFGWRRCQSGS